MKAKKYWIVGVIVVCSTVSLSLRASYRDTQMVKDSKATLEGMKVVVPMVMITMLGGEHEVGDKVQIGLLSENDLQTELEIAIGKAGIKIVPTIDNRVNSEAGGLLVMVGANKIPTPESLRSVGDELYVFEVDVSFSQSVKLDTKSNRKVIARTWPSTNYIEPVFAGSKNVEKKVRNRVMQEVNEFINDYLAANPKEQPKNDQNNN